MFSRHRSLISLALIRPAGRRLLISHSLLYHSIALPLLFLSTQSATADAPLFTVDSGSIGGSSLNLGYSFSLNHEVTVTGLAKHDANFNGLLDDQVAPEIGLWNSATSQLIAMTQIDERNQFRDDMFVIPIEPVRLSAGRYTVAAQFFRGDEPFLRIRGNTGVQSTEAVVVGSLNPVHNVGSSLTLPTAGSTLAFGPNVLFEQPKIRLSEPRAYSVTQRRRDNRGSIPVVGSFDTSSVSSIEVRAVSTRGELPHTTPWQSAEIVGAEFFSEFELPAGDWYEVEARGFRDGQQTAENRVLNVGVGEVFVVAGQSNSANHGQTPLRPSSDRVVTMGADRFWRPAVDPLPTATGSGGSPWPALGDLLVEALDVPVGIVSVGWGGTRVDQWQPGARGPDASGPLYNRLKTALEALGPHGARAVLWHQGESDNDAGTSAADYQQRLEAIIAQSRIDAGFDVPWGIAQASFVPTNNPPADSEIIAAQARVANDDPLNFVGAMTDDLTNPVPGDGTWRYDDLHFNEAGLNRHAQQWAEIVLEQIVPEPTSSQVLLLGAFLLMTRRAA